MKKYIIPTVLVVLTACVSSTTVAPEIANQIPPDANIINVSSELTKGELYTVIYRNLAQKGFSFTTENQEMGTLTTGFKDIGQGTVLSMNIFIDDTDEGSRAIVRGSWHVTASTGFGLSAMSGGASAGQTGERADWGSSGRPKLAFGEMAVIMNSLQNVRVEYFAE